MRFEPQGLPEYSEDALLGELRRVSSLVPNGKLTVRQFNQRAKISHSTILRHFGTWQAALTRAGLRERFDGSNQQVSKEELLAELRSVAADLNTTTLRKRDFNARARFSADSVLRRFGSWRKALQQASLTSAKLGHRYTDEECFENLLAVWTALGRQPKYREMNDTPSVVGGKAYSKRWGTWRKALHAFALRANSDEKSPDVIVSATSTISKLKDQPTPSAAERRDIPLSLRYKVLVRDRFRCVLCGRSPAANPGLELHIDHRVAFSRGGKTVIENLRSLCKDCNLGKGARDEEP